MEIPEVSSNKDQAIDDLRNLRPGDDLGLLYLGQVGLHANFLGEGERNLVKAAFIKIKDSLMSDPSLYGRLQSLSFDDFRITFDNPIMPPDSRKKFVTDMLNYQKESILKRNDKDNYIGAGSYGKNVGYAEKLGLITHQEAIDYLSL